jgi:DNA-binding MarR family transcriptional regulator
LAEFFFVGRVRQLAIVTDGARLTVTARLADNCTVQQLHVLTRVTGSADECAAEILETVPDVMRFIRAQMRRHRGPELSVPHFRALLFLSRNGGASLSTLAEFLGLSLPAGSRLVEGLVRKHFVVRRIPPRNHRLIALALSARGRRTVAAARQATERRLAKVVAPLPTDERAAIQRALQTLREKLQLIAGRDGFVKERS